MLKWQKERIRYNTRSGHNKLKFINSGLSGLGKGQSILMKLKKISAMLCAAVFSLALIAVVVTCFLPRQMRPTAIAAEKQAFDRQSVEESSAAFESAEMIYEKLRSMVIEDLNSDDDVEDDFDVDEAAVYLDELGADMARLDMLSSGLDAFQGGMDSSEGKTVLAVREYLTMLRNMSQDMYELLEYYIELYEALIILGDINEDTDDYSDFALELNTITGSAVESLEMITPPSYLKITHNDLILRIKEFQDFSTDFYVAVELEDPLRIYSCVYRMNRIESMLNRCVGNLTDDVKLQFEQADGRMTGPIAVLHDELQHSISLLLAV